MKLVRYVKDSYQELVHKVKWPTRGQLHSSAIVVMVASLIFAGVIVIIDLFFENLMTLVYDTILK